MPYFLIVCAIVLCGVVVLWWQRIRWEKRYAARLPESEFERKMYFILDVCDGNRKRSEALVAEKMTLNPTLSHEQAVDQVYADMLALTAEERNAIANYARHHAG
jgi:hypothetical protein